MLLFWRDAALVKEIEESAILQLIIESKLLNGLNN